MQFRATRYMACAALAWAATATVGTPALQATEIYGVQPAAIDQPQVNAVLRRTAAGDPLTATQEGITAWNIQAYLDTGASGILLSSSTQELLGVNLGQWPASPGAAEVPVVFEDVGVAGSDTFNVSEPLYVSLGRWVGPAGFDEAPDDPAQIPTLYTQTLGPYRMQVGPTVANPTMEGLDVVGMPGMAGKVVVMNPRPADQGADFMRNFVYSPATPFTGNFDNPGIPTVNRHVQLSYASFAQFTQTTPAGAPGPDLRDNPFIGPNPVLASAADTTPSITLSRQRSTGAKATAHGSFLLDTGAMTSLISQQIAASLGIEYAPGTLGTDKPILVEKDAAGVEHEIPNQFALTVGGIGGSIKLAGFFLDSLSLPTQEGDPLDYLECPVLVGDITAKDPVTGKTLTLDGLAGMNLFVASMYLSESITVGGFPDLGEVVPGNFDWLVFDEPNHTFGVQIPVPEPAAAGVLALAAMALLRRRH